MVIGYDLFYSSFLRKVAEYKFVEPELGEEEYFRDDMNDYMRSAIAQFNKYSEFKILNGNDDLKEFSLDLSPSDEEEFSGRLDDIADIVGEGMVLAWMTPYLYSSENFENLINTKDFSSYSPANLLSSIGDRYKALQNDFRQHLIDYTYDYGSYDDLSM